MFISLFFPTRDSIQPIISKKNSLRGYKSTGFSVKSISRKISWNWFHGKILWIGRAYLLAEEFLQDHLFWIMYQTKYLVGCVIQKGACLQFVQRSKKISPGCTFLGIFFNGLWAQIHFHKFQNAAIICIITQFCVTIFYVFYTYCVPP